ncbi:hypothetical protein V6Z12_A07G218600 [Gossypium hirsutum]
MFFFLFYFGCHSGLKLILYSRLCFPFSCCLIDFRCWFVIVVSSENREAVGSAPAT